MSKPLNCYFFSYLERHCAWTAWPFHCSLHQVGSPNNTDSCYRIGPCSLSVQLPLVGTDRLLMSPPLWGEGLTRCALTEGEQRSTELSTQFYAIQIFQDARRPFQKKSSICQGMKLIVPHKVIIDHVRLWHTSNFSIMYMQASTRSKKFCAQHVHFLIHSFGLYGITQKSYRRHRKVSLLVNLR